MKRVQIDDVALDPSDATQRSGIRRGGGFVTLSTVHSAKGLEWDSLFVIWMTDGWFPSNRFRQWLYLHRRAWQATVRDPDR